MRSAGLALLIVLVGCSGLTTPQAADDHELSDALAGRVAGSPIRCIDNSQTSSVRIIPPDTIIYSSTGRTLYRSTIQNCAVLRSYSTLITHQFGSQICEGDRFSTIEPGGLIPSAVCRFGAFVPYKLPAKH